MKIFSISRDHHKYAAVKWNTVILNARPFSTPGRRPWQLCWLLFSMQSTSKDQNVGLLVGLSQIRFLLSTGSQQQLGWFFYFPWETIESKQRQWLQHTTAIERHGVYFSLFLVTQVKKSVYKPTKHQLSKKVAKFSQICNIGDNIKPSICYLCNNFMIRVSEGFWTPTPPNHRLKIMSS